MRNLWHTLTQTYHQFIAKFVPNICMIWTWIKEVSRTVWCLVFRVFQDVRSYLISCYPMVRAFGVCLSQRFSKNRMTEPKCLICKSTNYNCGIVLVIILVFIALIGYQE